MISINTQSFFNIGLMGLLGLAVTPALAMEFYDAPFKDDGYVNQDWQLVCDNTLTCRAAGYADEREQGPGLVSILITAVPREAIPNVEVLAFPYSEFKGEIELWLNGAFYGQLTATMVENVYKLNQEQTQELLKLATQHASIEIVMRDGDNRQVGSISDNGMAAVLLKLDDVQGRVGSPLALVSKNHPNPQTPIAPRPIPRIYQGYSFPITEGGRYEPDENGKYRTVPHDIRYTKHISDSQRQYWQENMTSWVQPTLAQGDNSCDSLGIDDDFHGEGTKVWRFTPIDQQYTVASHRCWEAAYNFGNGYWVFENTNASEPILITMDGGSYTEGKITAEHKSRGLGDCWSLKEWFWNGETFVKSYEAKTGLCRSFAYGAWKLPTYVSEVIDNKQTQTK